MLLLSQRLFSGDLAKRLAIHKRRFNNFPMSPRREKEHLQGGARAVFEQKIQKEIPWKRYNAGILYQSDEMFYELGGFERFVEFAAGRRDTTLLLPAGVSDQAEKDRGLLRVFGRI